MELQKHLTSAGDGAYTITVNHGFAGTITPTKAGYTFTPASRSYASTPVITNLTNQNFTESLNTYTISGNTGTGSVLLSWTDGTPQTFTSAANGSYSITVNHGFAGTIIPTKAGYTFTPASRSYASTPVITNLTNQNFTESLNTYTISGNTGTGSVLLSWTDGTPQTFTSAANGSYSITVNHGFAGTIIPTKAGYTFTPASRSYASTPVITNLTNQNFTESLNTYTISGNTGTGSVLLSWTDGTPQTFTSAANGSYSITVNHGFAGTIIPTKAGYTFTPASRSYASTPVITNLTNQNFTESLNTYTISGNTGTGSVLLSWTDGTAKTFTSASDGSYSITVNYYWSGTVTPSKSGYTFSPASRNYNNVISNFTNENYTASGDITISGNTNVGTVSLSWFDGTLKTLTSGSNGSYSFTVPYNWSGTLTPTKTGYTFTPTNIVFTSVTTSQSDQNFIANVTISGSTGTGSVTLSWVDGGTKTTTSAINGSYTITVPYNWSGTITPTKVGYTFSPENKVYASVTSNRSGENYTAYSDLIISGNTNVGLTQLDWNDGTPKSIVSELNGNYSFTVPYNWSGVVTPTKNGYTFTPTNKTYSSIKVNQVNQNYLGNVTISGNSGERFVTLSWVDGTSKTIISSNTGEYTITVPYGWNGSITPTKSGFSFIPIKIDFSNVLTNLIDQDFTASGDVSISGNTNVGVATLTYTDVTVKTITSALNGDYSFTVPYNWSGTVTPSKIGFAFTPLNITYTNVTANQLSQNYIAYVTISGNTGTGSVTLSWTDGTIKTFTSALNGDYIITVPYNWSGTITPTKIGYSFNPVNRVYANVIANMITQNYMANSDLIISGNTNIGSTKLDWFDGTPKSMTSEINGNYSFTVPYNWSGTVTPSKVGFTYIPANINYTNVIVDQVNQNYIGNITITGNTGVGNVTLTWLDGTIKTVLSAVNGDYTITIPYGWNGTVTPSKVGFTFLPINRIYTNVMASQLNQNYTTYVTISISQNGTGTGMIKVNDSLATSFPYIKKFEYLKNLKIQSVPSVGSNFVNWTENNLPISSDSIYSFTVSINRIIIANFTKKIYKVDTKVLPALSGTTTGSGSYEHGQTVTISTVPNIGWDFVNWTEDSVMVFTLPSNNFMIEKPRNLIAKYQKKKYRITTKVQPVDTAGVTVGDSIYIHGDNVLLVATPNTGWNFVNWTRNDIVVQTDSIYSFVAQDSANFVANFVKKKYNITISVFPENSGTTTGQNVYSHGETVLVTATPSPGWLFVNWTENEVNVSNNRAILICCKQE